MADVGGLLSSSVLVASAQASFFLLPFRTRVLEEARLEGGVRARWGARPMDEPCPVELRGEAERLRRRRSGMLSLWTRRLLDVLILLEDVLLEVRPPEERRGGALSSRPRECLRSLPLRRPLPARSGVGAVGVVTVGTGRPEVCSAGRGPEGSGSKNPSSSMSTSMVGRLGIGTNLSPSVTGPFGGSLAGKMGTGGRAEHLLVTAGASGSGVGALSPELPLLGSADTVASATGCSSRVACPRSFTGSSQPTPRSSH